VVLNSVIVSHEASRLAVVQKSRVFLASTARYRYLCPLTLVGSRPLATRIVGRFRADGTALLQFWCWNHWESVPWLLICHTSSLLTGGWWDRGRKKLHRMRSGKESDAICWGALEVIEWGGKLVNLLSKSYLAYYISSFLQHNPNQRHLWQHMPKHRHAGTAQGKSPVQVGLVQLQCVELLALPVGVLTSLFHDWFYSNDPISLVHRAFD